MTKGKYEQQVAPGQHRLQINTKFPLLISLDNEPQHVAVPGKNKLIIRTEEGGILQIDPSDPKSEYGLTVTPYAQSKYDPVSDKSPPERPAPNNYIARLRQMTRDQMQILREEFADQRSIYEIGDVDRFEEQLSQEQNEKEKAEREALAHESAEQGVADPEPEADQADTSKAET